MERDSKLQDIITYRGPGVEEQQIESTNKEQLESLQKEIREQHNFLLEALREDVFDVLNDQFG